MSGIDLRNHVVSVTEGGETVALSREELKACRHSLDIIHALEAKLGHSLKHGYYFQYDALQDGWRCTSGDFGASRQPKEVIKEVTVKEYVDREVIKEVIKEVPVDKIVYVDKPVEIEKIVHVDRPVPVEVDRIVEKEVVKYVDRPVYVDKPVDRIVEREKKIYVERVVETPVKKIVEVPVAPTLKSLGAKWFTQAKQWVITKEQT